MNPKIDFLHFQGALLCSFVFHISIECALSDFFWFLLCTHIDHNQISCLRAQIDYESWKFACTMFSCFDCLCTLKIHFCVALITVKSKPLHVSIECAFLDYLLCCFVLTLFTIKFDILVYWLFMNPKSMLVWGFVVTLVTTIHESFVFQLNMHSQIELLCCFVLTLHWLQSSWITLWSQLYWTPSCYACLCTFIFPFVTAL